MLKTCAAAPARPKTAGVTAALFSFWCLFWMVQPAVLLPRLSELRWFGLPAHYAFWLLGMVVVVPASCFALTLWQEKRRRAGAPPHGCTDGE
ncbi:MAG: hypothetical protein GXP31_04340 [Kiritimatiellaeota bacterium]|nr:hypothetical protein [Kiritimatiellota bacterium]